MNPSLKRGANPLVRSKVTSEGQIPGARTFEPSWMTGAGCNISERRTKDGGYVSVGTDITNIKRHEEKLMESEKRLMATVADLRKSSKSLSGRPRKWPIWPKNIRKRKRARKTPTRPSQVSCQYEP